MGIFDKLKKNFIKEKKEVKTEEAKDLKIYDKGLTKTRDNFVSKLVALCQIVGVSPKIDKKI